MPGSARQERALPAPLPWGRLEPGRATGLAADDASAHAAPPLCPRRSQPAAAPRHRHLPWRHKSSRSPRCSSGPGGFSAARRLPPPRAVARPSHPFGPSLSLPWHDAPASGRPTRRHRRHRRLASPSPRPTCSPCTRHKRPIPTWNSAQTAGSSRPPLTTSVLTWSLCESPARASRPAAAPALTRRGPQPQPPPGQAGPKSGSAARPAPPNHVRGRSLKTRGPSSSTPSSPPVRPSWSPRMPHTPRRLPTTSPRGGPPSTLAYVLCAPRGH